MRSRDSCSTRHNVRSLSYPQRRTEQMRHSYSRNPERYNHKIDIYAPTLLNHNLPTDTRYIDILRSKVGPGGSHSPLDSSLRGGTTPLAGGWRTQTSVTHRALDKTPCLSSSPSSCAFPRTSTYTYRLKPGRFSFSFFFFTRRIAAIGKAAEIRFARAGENRTKKLERKKLMGRRPTRGPKNRCTGI